MTKQVCGEVLYRVKYRNMGGQEYMHVPVDRHREYGKMMTSISTTAKRTVSNPSTKPSPTLGRA